ncbi:putative ATPase [Flavobacterium sp. 7E]|uniref:AAA family ATPase n=1 Tax=Flavobacterium sp. 7E TaxID=2735898 RepID=UPI00156F67DF|nr:ATP-binding protein [Flavobacterium sp. 7E]NRS89484.1 putative ATPase [Flavobacterium sp. 7E]
MERAKLIVKNFGPIKDIEIEVREMVTFIGAQASGKSTLAKLLSIFEDEAFRKDNTITFKGELKKYNILSYLKDDSYISYGNSLEKEIPFFTFEYERKISKKLSLSLFDKISHKQLKQEHIETSLSISDFKQLVEMTINDYELIDKVNFTKIFDSKSQVLSFENTFKNIRVVNSNVIREILQLFKKEESVENYLFLFNKIINSFPNIFLFDSIYVPSERNFIHLIAENTLGLINNNVRIPKHLLHIGQEYEKAIQTIKELPLTIIDKKLKYKREGKTSYVYHDKDEKIDLLESASGLQSIIPILLLVEYSKSLKDKYNFNFVVEEPELNLYPKAQHELIKYLIKNCVYERKNLILTTHSPFVLASINNLLLAYDKGQSKPKEVNKIIKKESWLNPKNFIAYELKNGKAKKIMDDKLGQIKENMIDSVSDSFADEFDKLLDL